MAKHTAPPRRRHSAQKHTSHKGVTLYTLGVLLVAVSVLLSLRFWPRRIVDAVPPAAEVEPPAVSEELAVPEPHRGCSSSGSGGGAPCCFGGACRA